MVDVFRGQRQTPLTWELSLLDLSIQEYERKCKDYHYRKLKKTNETPTERDQRLLELSKAKAHLDTEYLKLYTMAQVDGKLQAYRDEFKHLQRRERQREYEREGHHPTEVLESNLRASGRAQPSPRYTAHHIVEGQGKLAETKLARAQLFRYDVRINDSDNGVWMPMTEADRGHWAMPKAVPHSRIHTHNYERWVSLGLRGLRSELTIRAKLTFFRTMLKHGLQPEKVLKKPDPNWNGEDNV